MENLMILGADTYLVKAKDRVMLFDEGEFFRAECGGNIVGYGKGVSFERAAVKGKIAARAIYSHCGNLILKPLRLATFLNSYRNFPKCDFGAYNYDFAFLTPVRECKQETNIKLKSRLNSFAANR